MILNYAKTNYCNLGQMSAQQSLEHTIKAIDKMCFQNLKICRLDIKKAIAAGRFNTECYSLGEVYEAMLVKEGYQVTPHKNLGNTGPLYTRCDVSWSQISK